jgi:hypothetical protein
MRQGRAYIRATLITEEHLSLEEEPLMSHVRVGSFRVKLPRSKGGRQALGGALVAGGALSFLPVLGLWMLPAGLLVLSVDSPRVRRFRRINEIRVVRWWRSRRSSEATD